MFGRTIVSIYDIQPAEIERQRQKQEQRERNRQQRQQRYREHYRNTEDSEPSQSEYDSEYEWKEVRQPNYRNQRNRQYRDKQYSKHNNITNRKHQQKHTMKENPSENNEQNYPTLKTQTIKKTNTEQQKPKTDAKKQTEKEKHNQQTPNRKLHPINNNRRHVPWWCQQGCPLVLFAEKVVLCYTCKTRHMLGENSPVATPRKDLTCLLLSRMRLLEIRLLLAPSKNSQLVRREMTGALQRRNLVMTLARSRLQPQEMMSTLSECLLCQRLRCKSLSLLLLKKILRTEPM